MRFSQSFIPTLRDEPADAELVSHKLMVRAGFIRKAAAGVYTWMPIGLRVLRNIENIVREEMDNIGCLELLMPVLQPSELWKESGRWDAYGYEMMRLVDRHEREFCLGPTHEELITTIAKEINTYKELPKCLYQIQVKFRDEIRPRYGVMRSREFFMKDAYSFHATQESLDETYGKMQTAYSTIVERCGLSFRAVKAAGGLIGGAVSEEFMVLAETGEDTVVYCPSCSYAANLDTASSHWHIVDDEEEVRERQKIHTPNSTSIKKVADLLEVSTGKLVKTLIYKAGDVTIAALVPGPKELNEHKLLSAASVSEARLYTEQDFAQRPDLIAGYVGPVGLKNVKIVADQSLRSLRNVVVGANEADHHLVNVNVEKDFDVDIWADIVYAEVGETCVQCKKDSVQKMKGIEVGHIFQLGTKYSSALSANFVDSDGRENPLIMGCYGVGVSRLAAAAIEQNSDDRGMIWPESIAPFDIHLINLNKDENLRELADSIYEEIVQRVDVLYDDRGVSAGIKFADADLIGIPVQIICGKTLKENGALEVKIRATGERLEIKADGLVEWLESRNHGT